MAKKRKKKRAAGIVEEVKTARASYSQRRTKSGRIVFRKGSRTISERAYNTAKNRKTARVESFELSRAGKSIRGRQDWVIEDGKTKYGRAGVVAKELLPGVRKGQKLTKAQRAVLMADIRNTHGFQSWQQKMEGKLSAAEASAKWLEMMEALRHAKTPKERNKIRVEYGVDESSGERIRRAKIKRRTRERLEDEA